MLPLRALSVAVATCAPTLARVGGFVIALLAAVPATPADPVELPLEAEVLADKIALDLRGGRVEVVFDPEQAPSLSVHDILRPDSAEGLVLVDQTEDGLTIGQPHGTERVAPRLYTKLVLRPGTKVSITGEDLAITVAGFDPVDLPDPLAEAIAAAQQAAAAPPGTPPTPAGGAGPAAAGENEDASVAFTEPDVRIAVSRSTASVNGVTAMLDGNDSRFIVERASGLLRARLLGGDLRIEGCAGRAEINASDADIVLRRFGGSSEFSVERGSILVDFGAGSLAGRAREGRLLVERWFGGLIAEGGRSRIELRGAGSPKSEIRLTGNGDDVIAEELAGRVSLTLDGGRLDAKSMAGTLGLDARGQAEVSVAGARGNCELRISDGTRAKVKGVEQRLTSTVKDARLEIEKTRDLDLRTTSSMIIAQGVAGRATIRAVDSELDLDLGSATSNPSLELSGATRAKVALPSPCAVRVNGTSEDARERVTVTGCEMEGAGARPRYSPRQQVIVAETKLGDTATLDVRSGS